ncbi:hypothetical protein BC831DRAFT_441604 [Entophlyctis helioformis]|nr:hypothetical protein BC831DRAFT_441604 [Entophlyctis helioformis]
MSCNPFQLEPVRANVLQEPQIHKEIHALETHMAALRASISESEKRIQAHEAALPPASPRAHVPSIGAAPGYVCVTSTSSAATVNASTSSNLSQQTQKQHRQATQPHGKLGDPASGTSDSGHGTRTSDLYSTDGKLPSRFEEPGSWNYKIKEQHPLYTTTTNQHGQMRPTVHDMPTVFHGQESKFTEHLNMAGPYRNFSLNI